MDQSLKKILIAELFATFWIVFAGKGAIIVNDIGGIVSHIDVAIILGLIVFAMISALGDISSTHLNPAVPIAFYLTK